MKNILRFVVLSVMAFSGFTGCSSILSALNQAVTPYQRIRADSEKEIIGTEKIFKSMGKPTPVFKFIEKNGLPGIEL